MLNTKRLLGLFVALSGTTAAMAEGVSPKAANLFEFGGGITNSMVTGWVVSALLIGLILWFVRNPKILPGKAQAVFESLLEALRDLFEPIVVPAPCHALHLHPRAELVGPPPRRRHDRDGAHSP
jgi:F-type H+-transporting ATPase subunit a